MGARKGVAREELTTVDSCGLVPSCFDCPLEDCRYDGSSYHKTETIERRRKIQELKKEGFDTKQIAGLLNVSLRTVYRAS